MISQEYKAVIFDLGKVIFDYSFSKAYKFWATTANKSFEDIKGNFHFDKTFEDFESGKISADQFRREILQRLNLNLSNDDFDTGWCSIYLDTYSEIDKLLLDLKKKYRVVALTNTNIIHSSVWRVKYFNTLQHFEKIFCSYELGTRKPESKAFQIVLDYLQTKPTETIFLDDNIDNIKGAIQLDIATIWVTSQEKMNCELLQHGLLN